MGGSFDAQAPSISSFLLGKSRSWPLEGSPVFLLRFLRIEKGERAPVPNSRLQRYPAAITLLMEKKEASLVPTTKVVIGSGKKCSVLGERGGERCWAEGSPTNSTGDSDGKKRKKRETCRARDGF